MLHKIKKHNGFISAIEKLGTNVKKWKLIGKGSFGYAYDMNDGRVCKITTNEHETKVAIRISKKKYSYLYKVIDVFILKNANNKFRCGLIITPKYKKLTVNEKDDLYELFCFLELTPRFRLRSVKQIKAKIKKAVNDYYSTRSVWPPIGLNNVIRKRLKIFNKYNILYILRNLKTANLGPEDMHYENILKDGDHYILIDIAC